MIITGNHQLLVSLALELGSSVDDVTPQTEVPWGQGLPSSGPSHHDILPQSR